MRFVLSTFLMIVLSTALSAALAVVSFGAPVQAAVQIAQYESIAVLPGLKGAFAGDRPTTIGVKDGVLSACPASPNCVVSQRGDADHAITPIAYSSDRATARQNLIDILGVVPRTQIVEQRDDYILAESESRLMGFVDDNEFYLPTDEKVIHMRAAARLGESDLGVNRRRLEQIRLAFNDLSQRDAAPSSSTSPPLQ